ncbi:MAG: dTDP-4-dehydrorhamnose 3,5-epimerase [Nanoarchaeota archaeon]
MQVVQTSLSGVLEIHPQVFKDERGDFFENYSEKKLESFGIPRYFPLEFQSTSKKGVLRGLHFQKKPFAQCKLVRVVRGKVFDVVVDIRKKSPTYGKWISMILSAENRKMLWIPEGFAHGFLSLEDDTVMLYKLTNHYDPASMSGLMWNDPDLDIDWKLKEYGISEVLLSEKDKQYSSFKELGELF